MAHAVPFDTLAYAKNLEAHGIIAEHAEAHAQALAHVLEENVSTKQETQDAVSKLEASIHELKNDMDTKFAHMDAKFSQMDAKFSQMDAKFSLMDAKVAQVNANISNNRAELIKWGIGISFAQAALIISVLKILN